MIKNPKALSIDDDLYLEITLSEGVDDFANRHGLDFLDAIALLIQALKADLSAESWKKKYGITKEEAYACIIQYVHTYEAMGGDISDNLE